MEIAKSGEAVTHKKVQELKQAHQAKNVQQWAGTAELGTMEVTIHTENGVETKAVEFHSYENDEDWKRADAEDEEPLPVEAEILGEEEAEELEELEEIRETVQSGDFRRVYLFLVGFPAQYRSIFREPLKGRQPFFDYDDEGLKRIEMGVENVMSFLELIEMDVKAIRSYREEERGLIRDES